MSTAVIILLLVAVILIGLALFGLRIVVNELDRSMYSINDRLDTYGLQLDELNKRTYDIQTQVRSLKLPTHE